MSAVSDVVTQVEINVGDESATRYSADTYLNMVKQAINRVNRILQRNGIQFAKKYTDTTVTSGQAYISMPVDFDVDIFLGISLTGYELKKKDEDSWNACTSADANSYYLLDYVNSLILLKGTPTDSTTIIRIWYYPTVDTSAYTTATTMPWSGRVDDIISQYVAMRLLNIAEMDVSMELQLLTDMENQIIEAYKPLSQTTLERDGWMSGMNG